MRQYNRIGIKEVHETNDDMDVPKFQVNKNLSSLLRLFIVTMVFVVVVLTIAK